MGNQKGNEELSKTMKPNQFKFLNMHGTDSTICFSLERHHFFEPFFFAVKLLLKLANGIRKH